jgi:hypothetical protein
MEITRKEFDRIKHLKILDIQVCDFCHRINILNLGRKPWGKFYCRLHEADYLVCWKLCYKVCLNIWDCELYSEAKEVQRKEVKVSQKHYKSNCYLCFKELEGAGKTGKIKNRNNPSFWGIESEWKVLCLGCLGKKFYKKLSGSKRKTFNKYLKRGHE